MKLGPHRVVVVRAGEAPGDYGNRTQADWGNATEATVDGCSVQPVPAPEFSADRSTALTRWQVWAPATADVRATDRIVWNDNTYDVDGDPLHYDFGAMGHLVINLRRSEDS